MELRELRVFVAIADEAHVGRAARRLLLSQQAASKTLAHLEQREVRAPLFVRSPTGMQLTALGELLLNHARAVVAAADALEAELRSHRELPSGTLRVGLLAGGAGEATAPILRAFCDAFPQVQLQLSDIATTDHVRPLVEGSIDAALMWGPVDDDRVEVRQLFSELRVAVLSPRNPRADAAQLSTGDLLDMGHGDRLPGEPERWEGFWNLVDERNGQQPRRVASPQGGSVASQLRQIGLQDLLVTLPSSAQAILPAAVLGIRYIPVVDLAPATAALVTLRTRTADPLVRAFRMIAETATENLR